MVWGHVVRQQRWSFPAQFTAEMAAKAKETQSMASLPLEMLHGCPSGPQWRCCKREMEGGQPDPALGAHRPQGGLVPEAPLWPSRDTVLCWEGDGVQAWGNTLTPALRAGPAGS